MEASSMTHTAVPAKKKVPFILLIIALAILFGMSLVTLAASVLLYVNDNSQKDEIAALKDELASINKNGSKMNDQLSILQTEKAALQSKLTSITDVELAAIKGDIMLLKDKSKDTDVPGFNISNLNLSFDDADSKFDYFYGEATVTCDDAAGGYVVIVKQTHISGGMQNREQYQYFLMAIGDGSGKFYTTDWAEKGKLERPEYTYEIIGVIKTTGIAK